MTGYKVEVSDDNGRTWKLVEMVDAPLTQCTAKGLTEGQKYLFRVAAVNEVGAGEALESEKITPEREPCK